MRRGVDDVVLLLEYGMLCHVGRAGVARCGHHGYSRACVACVGEYGKHLVVVEEEEEEEKKEEEEEEVWMNVVVMI